MHGHVTRAVVDRAQHAVDVARDLMRMAQELAEWNREKRVRLAEERAAVREVSRSGSYRQ
jgi:hypothetical protein